jgi:hypothetical protein
VAVPDVVERIMGRSRARQPPRASAMRRPKLGSLSGRPDLAGRPPARQRGCLRRHQSDIWGAVYLRLCFVEGLGRLGFEGGGP